MGAQHGTRSRYVAGCRCDLCATANREYRRRWEERAVKAGPPVHGLGGYKNYRCRCEVCSAASAAYHRAYHAERRRRNRPAG